VILTSRLKRFDCTESNVTVGGSTVDPNLFKRDLFKRDLSKRDFSVSGILASAF
jgi:hypothetical protein